MFNNKIKERLDKIEETQQKIIDFLEIEEEKYIGQSIISTFGITRGLDFNETDVIKTRFIKKQPLSDKILNQTIVRFEKMINNKSKNKPKKK